MCPGLLFCVYMWPVTYDFWLLLVLLKCLTVILIWPLEATAKNPFSAQMKFLSSLQKLFDIVSLFLRKCIPIYYWHCLSQAPVWRLVQSAYELWSFGDLSPYRPEGEDDTKRKPTCVVRCCGITPKNRFWGKVANTARDKELTPSSDMSFYYFGVFR